MLNNKYSEAYQLALYVLNQYCGTAVSCRYIIPSGLLNPDTQPALRDRFEAAIVNTVLKQPILQVGIVGAESKRPVFTQLERLDLGNHVEWHFLKRSVSVEAVLHEAIISQIDAPFPDLERQPGWRIVILRQEMTDFLEVLFVWNHPHGDGTSGRIFHQDLLRSLNYANATTPDLNGNIVTLLSSPPKLPVPVEKLSSLPMDAKYITKTLWGLLSPPMLSKHPSQAKWAPIRKSPYKTQVRSFTVDRGSLNNILAKCRQHKTTLTGLLHGLAALSFVSRIKDAPAFQGGTPVDARRFLPADHPDYPGFEPALAMANYVTMMDHEFDTALVSELRSAYSQDNIPEQVWSVAAQVRHQIEMKLASGLKNDEICLGRFVKDWRAQMVEKAAKPRKLSWLVTNLGVLDGGPTSDSTSATGGWSIQRAQFILSAEVPGAAIVFSPISVANQGLCVTTNWQEGIFDTGFGDQVVGDMERWLQRIGSE